MSEWGAWEEAPKPHDDRTGVSMPVTERVDGSEVRKQMMAQKTELAEDRRRCRADGSCPELAMRQSEGPIDCIGGKFVLFLFIKCVLFL